MTEMAKKFRGKNFSDKIDWNFLWDMFYRYTVKENCPFNFKYQIH